MEIVLQCKICAVAVANQEMLSALDKAIKHFYHLIGKSADTLASAQKYFAKNCFVTHNYTSFRFILVYKDILTYIA